MLQADTIRAAVDTLDAQVPAPALTARDVAEIAELVNQTPFWLDALGVFVAVLGVLFAAGAVGAAYWLFRQSREHREEVDRVIASYRAVLDGLIAETNRRIDANIKLLQEQHAALLEEIGDAGERRIEEANRKFEEAIADLEEQRVKPESAAMTFDLFDAGPSRSYSSWTTIGRSRNMDRLMREHLESMSPEKRAMYLEEARRITDARLRKLKKQIEAEEDGDDEPQSRD